ncbi:hypothetical protein CISG_05386 [Coccidioides immitis RMSCC 3703]|uniref:Uncharacterized protein n=2 Tax=Coccidioides immitis TaxID=5501 RepID=A0A0J8QTW2_COCIT|nr:hypothetical protein CIRG_00721 [Coccidioides immitis RMSCC 2394]KMU75901.1 hypothetical protein CISG_05386 [Coccidioides immitis RMSCC 3703]
MSVCLSPRGKQGSRWQLTDGREHLEGGRDAGNVAGGLAHLNKYERKVTQAASRARPVTSLPAPRCSSSAAATAKPFFTVLRLVTGRRGRGEEASLQSGYNIEGSSLQAYPARPSGEAQKHMHKRGEMGLRQAPSD